MNPRNALRRLKRPASMGYALAVRIQTSWRTPAATQETEIVIDGFPRSGNTFVTVAFLLAQQRPVNIAHHLHSPFQSIRAWDLGVPSLVPIREPIDAVASLCVTQAWRDPVSAPREYGDYYQRINDWPVIANFNRVTTDLSTVVAEVSSRFGSGFNAPPADADSETVFGVIDVLSSMRSARVSLNRVARPTAERTSTLERLRDRLADPSDTATRRAAARTLRVYDNLSWGIPQ